MAVRSARSSTSSCERERPARARPGRSDSRRSGSSPKSASGTRLTNATSWSRFDALDGPRPPLPASIPGRPCSHRSTQYAHSASPGSGVSSVSSGGRRAGGSCGRRATPLRRGTSRTNGDGLRLGARHHVGRALGGPADELVIHRRHRAGARGARGARASSRFSRSKRPWSPPSSPPGPRLCSDESLSHQLIPISRARSTDATSSRSLIVSSSMSSRLIWMSPAMTMPLSRTRSRMSARFVCASGRPGQRD